MDRTRPSDSGDEPWDHLPETPEPRGWRRLVRELRWPLLDLLVVSVLLALLVAFC